MPSASDFRVSELRVQEEAGGGLGDGTWSMWVRRRGGIGEGKGKDGVEKRKGW